DGIRDKLVTGVQTCALPISPARPCSTIRRRRADARRTEGRRLIRRRELSGAERRISSRHCRREESLRQAPPVWRQRAPFPSSLRSEERRVGKEWRPALLTES